MNARDVALATIMEEHRSLQTVLEVLQHMVHDLAAEHGHEDFRMLAAALWYIDDFPERCHHPKEDEYVFKALRKRTAAFNERLDELQAEHIRSGQLILQLYRALARYQGGAPGAFGEFRSLVDAYATMLYDHMHKEDVLLAEARDTLPGDDWAGIAAVFAENKDPLFGAEPTREFGRLYTRIVNLLPHRMRRQLHRER